MPELPKQYEPKDHEEAIYKEWEEAGVFQPHSAEASRGRPSEKEAKQPFVIMLPPPNITGSLHMGHALQDVIMDILSRWRRMAGDPVLWLPGTDHAALPTNKIIVDQLAAEGKKPEDIGREAFLEKTQAWYEKTGKQIIGQMKRLGCSCDWSRERFTLDTQYYAAVQEAFIRYYQKGYIYRGSRLVNWDPQTQTTVSDLEIEWKTEKTPLYTFRYGPFEISTARPETKFGDKYVVMHPDDSRYAQYKDGQHIEVEWINGKVKATIIKDTAVDPSFGTGVMTITPWHDATDFEIAERHGLHMEQIIDVNGQLLPIAGEFAGQPIAQARVGVVQKLQDKGLLVGMDDTYTHNVAINDRGKGVIEPQVMRQWFLNMEKLKGETIEVVEKELVQFSPGRWKHHFITWMENVRDWNINRQIWLGHRLPVWWKKGTHGTEKEEGNFVVSLERPDGDFEQDPDVLDTWFSSALWPFATLGWPHDTEDLRTFYPTSVLVTARDILYLWVARMIFSGLELLPETRTQAEKIPFRHVFIHPTVLAKSGQRMSKSLGTGVDPLELIEKYGADATRFGLMHQLTFDSQAMKFDEEGIRAARNFGNKLWNIARLLQGMEEREERSLADEWIEARFADITQAVTQLLGEYKIGEAARLLHDFVWKDFADWYVEILKTAGSTGVAQRVFMQTVQLLHPFVPHITEVLWRQLGGEGMVAVSEWPHSAEASQPSREATAGAARGTPSDSKEILFNIARFQDIVNTARSARTLLGIKPGSTISLHAEGDVPLASALEAMTRATLIAKPQAGMHHLPLKGGGTIAIGSDEITSESIAAAQQKLQKEHARLKELIAGQSAILDQMRGKAPAEKVAEKEGIVRTSTERLAEVELSLNLLAGT